MESGEAAVADCFHIFFHYFKNFDVNILKSLAVSCVKLRKRLGTLQPGDVMRLRADDPAAIIDVPHFCTEAGHTLVETVDEGSSQIYIVRKGT